MRLTRSSPGSLAATLAAQPSMSLAPLAPFFAPLRMADGKLPDESQLHGVPDRKDHLTRAPYTSFCRCRVAAKKGRISPREVLWNPNFGSPVRVTRTFGGLQNH